CEPLPGSMTSTPNLLAARLMSRKRAGTSTGWDRMVGHLAQRRNLPIRWSKFSLRFRGARMLGQRSCWNGYAELSHGHADLATVLDVRKWPRALVRSGQQLPTLIFRHWSLKGLTTITQVISNDFQNRFSSHLERVFDGVPLGDQVKVED